LLTFFVALPGPPAARATDPVHSIAFTKGCVSPTKIADPYTCSYTVRNVVDEAGDTLRIDGLDDVVHAWAGDADSGNIFSALNLNSCSTSSGSCTQTTATCRDATGSGTRVDPWIGATSCTLPSGSRINADGAWYTVAANDFNLPGHMLLDIASLTWHDLCDGTPSPNCVQDPPDVTAGSQTSVVQLAASTATKIHNQSHQVVTTVAPNSIVHDSITVSGPAGGPAPTGSVSVEWFTNGSCSGAPAASSGEDPLAGSQWDATEFPQGPLAAGAYAFRGHYAGDPANPVYAASDGPCEPLSVHSPTGVTVLAFRATRSGRSVIVRWRTAMDAGIAGFVVYRDRAPVRPEPIRASGAAGGAPYVLVDAHPSRGVLRYRLRIIRLDGSSAWSDTVVVRER
jgi:hypothetical protein